MRMAAVRASMAASWPKTTIFRSRSRLRRDSVSEVETCLGRDARDLGDDGLDVRPRRSASCAWQRAHELHIGPGLVDHVDGLVRQVAVVDVAVGQLGRGAQGRMGVGDLVVFLEAGLQPLEDLDGLLDVGSSTSIFWKRRASARSFSKMPRYS